LLKKLEVRRFGDGTKRKPRGKKLPAGQSYSADNDSQEDSDEAESELESELESEPEEDRDKEDEEVADEECEELPDLDGPGNSNIEKFVVAAYEGQWFLAEVTMDQKNVTKGYTRLSYMTIKGNNCFSWGEKPDIHVALNEDILLETVSPEPVNSRGSLGLKKKDLMMVESLMVVVYYLFTFFNLNFITIYLTLQEKDIEGLVQKGFKSIFL
jgi:hypothetical protein